MTWVAWRQCRSELLIALAILAAMSAYLVPTGLDKIAEFRDSGLEACLSTQDAQCLSLRDRFVMSYDSVNAVVGWFNFVPGIIGLLLAAPLILEIEQRTYRLAWTQSVSRVRWLLASLGMAMLGVVLVSLLLTGLLTWFHSPIDRVDGDSGRLRESFGFEGVLPLAYTLFAFALASAAGVLSRKLLIVIPVALVGFLVTRLTLEGMIRPGVRFGGSDGPAEQLIGASDVQRFWTYQAIEGAIYLFMAVVLLALTVWVIRRQFN